jgi:integrase
VKGLFRPHYVTWSEQQRVESHAPQYLRNVIRIVTETGLRIYKELTPLRKDQVDLQNAVVWIPDSKTPNGIAEVPLSSLAVEAFKAQMAISGEGPFLFSSNRIPNRQQTTLKTVWRKTLRRAKIAYLRIYDLRSTYATRLSAGGVADEWVTQMLRQTDTQVRDETTKFFAISKKVGGHDRDRTGDPLLAKHRTRFHPLHPLLPTTNVSNKSGNLLSLKS